MTLSRRCLSATLLDSCRKRRWCIPVRIFQAKAKEMTQRHHVIRKAVVKFTWVYRDAYRHDSAALPIIQTIVPLMFKGKFTASFPVKGNSYWGSPGE